MTPGLRLEGRNAPARLGALARLALVPVLLLFEALETAGTAEHDLWFGEPTIGVLAAYAVVSAVVAYGARRDVPAAPFVIADTVLLATFVCAEGGAVADARFMLFVPVLVAIVAGPRLTLGIALLSVTGFAIAALANPNFGDTVGWRLFTVHALDLAWRNALIVVVTVLLARRAARIRELAESRRSLVTQALSAEGRARRELSYALHDELVQELLCAQQDLKVARRGRPEYIDRAEAALASAVARLREQIFQLHPHLLERAGLQAALEAVAAQQTAPDGATTSVTVAPDAAGADDELLFSVGRELLTNALRHAGAHEIALTVEPEGERIVLACRDDGRGMAPGRRAEALAGGHLGLAACTERVEALGGTLEVRTAPEGGTVVRAAIPDPRVEAAARRDPAPASSGLSPARVV